MEIIFGDDEFRRKVAHLTTVADRHPLLFRARVLLWVLAGYSALFLILIACVAIVAIACWQLLFHFIEFRIVYFGWAVLPALIFAGMIWRALWIELPEPKGVPIKRDEAPDLFRGIDEMRNKLDTPPIHSVQFDWYLNAAFTQRPRFGIFGWTKGYLTIGLPLLLGMSAENLRATLAHELGHFSRNHGRFSSWVYSVNETWEQFLRECRLRRGGANAIFVSLGTWYLRELRAHSFMLARTHEYEADQCAAELCGKAEATQSLVRLNVVTRFLGERFWPIIWRESKLQAAPPADVFVRMKMAMENGWSATDDAEWRNQALAEKSDVFDYHPSLLERLSALGGLELSRTGESLAPATFANRQLCAAAALLGTQLNPIMARINESWTNAVKSDWQATYREESAKRQKLDGVRQSINKEAATDEHLCQLARLTREVEGDEAAQPIVEAAIKLNEAHAESQLLLAQILLREGNSEGVAHAERAMELDRDLALKAALAVEGFLTSQGKQTEATEYLRAKEKQYDLFGQTARQKRRVGPNDRLLPHGLTRERLAPIAANLSGTGLVSEAFLVKKQIDGDPTIEVFVLGIVLEHRKQTHTFASGMDVYKKAALASASLGDVTIVVLDGSNRKIRRVMRAVQDSQILP